MSRPAEDSVRFQVQFRDLYPDKLELLRSIGPMLRGSFLGFFHRAGSRSDCDDSTFVSYSVEKGSAAPGGMGQRGDRRRGGAGIGQQQRLFSAMIPLRSLGLPFSSSAAILLGGFMIHGISPGPLLMTSNPNLFWGLIASMCKANPDAAGPGTCPWSASSPSLLKVPLTLLMPIVAIITFTGAYAINYSVFDLGLLLKFGLLGYFLNIAGFELAPLAIGVFWAGHRKRAVQGLTICDGSFLTMLHRPIAGTLWF